MQRCIPAVAKLVSGEYLKNRASDPDSCCRVVGMKQLIKHKEKCNVAFDIFWPGEMVVFLIPL